MKTMKIVFRFGIHKPSSHFRSKNLPEASNSQHTLLSLDVDESSMTGFESKFAINLPELTNMPQRQNEFGVLNANF